MAIGRALAKEYRERHAGREPDATERVIDGTTRYVNAYNPQKDPWTLDFAWQDSNHAAFRSTFIRCVRFSQSL